MELLESIMDASNNTLQFVNRDGIITCVNRGYGQIHNVKAEDVIGNHVTGVMEKTRMHIVATTGIAEVGAAQAINNRRYMVNRFPVFRGNKCSGAWARRCTPTPSTP
jgi:transcriptional regulator with PAS, ATPase and Fis domain